MFTIIWMKSGAVVLQESSALNRGEEVVGLAHAKATSGLMGDTLDRPDAFRVIDDTGREVARQRLAA